MININCSLHLKENEPFSWLILIESWWPCNGCLRLLIALCCFPALYYWYAKKPSTYLGILSTHAYREELKEFSQHYPCSKAARDASLARILADVINKAWSIFHFLENEQVHCSFCRDEKRIRYYFLTKYLAKEHVVL